jgi:molybdopterin synthase catalytic subunit
MIDQWIKEIKKEAPAEMLGMILSHNGIVRATAKDGGKVQAMNLSYDKEKLADAVREFKKREGIADIRVWINEGHLKIGDDIMKVCVAGRFRIDVLPVFQEFISMIKNEIVREEEL